MSRGYRGKRKSTKRGTPRSRPMRNSGQEGEEGKGGRSSPPAVDEARIVRYLADTAGRPLTVKELGEGLEVPPQQRRGLRAAVDRLVENGSVIRIKGGRLALPSRVHLVTGKVTISHYGDGIVTGETDSRENVEKVYVPAARLGGSMNGDQVVVRVERAPVRGRHAEGRVIRVVKRARTEIVAFYGVEDGVGIAHPQDERVGPAVIIPPGREGMAIPGQLTVVRLTAYPEKGTIGRGEVVEVLGEAETLETQTRATIHAGNLPHRFPRKVTGECAALPRKPSAQDIEGREDLRPLPFVTIDGVKAKDFDDALFARPNGDGSIDLYVSIADVSHYVEAGSATDREALLRGNSVYFPESVIPMLPERLSNGLCSLNPGVPRLTFTCQVRLDRNGNPVKHRLYESVIRSAARLTYRQVEDYLSSAVPPEGASAAVLENLDLLAEAFSRLKGRRQERKSLDFDLPEPEVVLSATGQVENIYRAERYTSHKVVEECMLLANEVVGKVLRESGGPGVYRVHEPPGTEKIEELNRLLASLGLRVPPSARNTAPFRKILESTPEGGKSRFLNTVILRTMMRAHYFPEPEGHFALALGDYAHFTSPIRRYADLVVHRLLKTVLGYTPPAVYGDLAAICEHISETERTAETAERDLLAWLRTKFMADKVGQNFTGTVSAVTSFGFFVELEEFFIEGLVHLSSLIDDYYLFHEDRLILVGENTGKVFRLGDRLTIQVVSVNLPRRHVDFMPVDPESSGRSPAGIPPRGSARSTRRGSKK
ncbi:MAG: ribonuclease R [bacterium]|nr:ribonuclease R [bacterium]MDT8396753.1 ribonuclease R [bacterium]